MKIIKELSNDIEHSLDAAEIYAKKALMYKKEHGDPPAGMKVLYDYLHERFIEKEAAIKQLQSLYKE